MDPNTVIAIASATGAGVAALGAIAAAIAAFVALKPAHRAAIAAEEQTGVQRDLMHQAAQPYVWADVQPDTQQGTMLQLVVGNAGPTMAREIHIAIDPPIPEHPSYSGMTVIAQKRVSDGILSLAPGRIIRWSLGRGFDLLESEDDETTYRLRVTGIGPYGELDPVEFEVRPRDWRESRDAPDGNLHLVRKEIANLAGETKILRQTIQTRNATAPAEGDLEETTLADSIVQLRQKAIEAKAATEEDDT